MTGFARAEQAVGSAVVKVEIKSVNGRGLDLRLRLANGLDASEIPLRQLLSTALARGSVTLTANVSNAEAATTVVVNETALAAVLETLEALGSRLEAAPPRLDGILALPGVLTVKDAAGEVDEAALAEGLLACAGEAIAALLVSRREEGMRIAAVLSGLLDTVATLVDQAGAHPSRSRENVEARLRQQLAMLGEDINIAPERLAQEALLLATKADIREEIDRLRAHIAAARKLLAEGGPVGRKFDFLTQEFNREANTLCSKSNAVDLTSIGLDLKAVIDQLREQVQNIE